MNTIADRLEVALKETGHTVAEVIRRGGPSRPTIYRIQNDPTYVPESYTLERLSRALDVSLEWLALGEGPMVLGVADQTEPYRVDPFDHALLGACHLVLADELARRGGTRPEAAKIGAVLAEVYSQCQRESKQPTPELVAPFIRVLLA